MCVHREESIGTRDQAREDGEVWKGKSEFRRASAPEPLKYVRVFNFRVVQKDIQSDQIRASTRYMR